MRYIRATLHIKAPDAGRKVNKHSPRRLKDVTHSSYSSTAFITKFEQSLHDIQYWSLTDFLLNRFLEKFLEVYRGTFSVDFQTKPSQLLPAQS